MSYKDDEEVVGPDILDDGDEVDIDVLVAEDDIEDPLLDDDLLVDDELLVEDEEGLEEFAGLDGSNNSDY